VHDVTESKSRRFFGGVKGIIPLILAQKRAGIRQRIQGFLSNATESLFLLPSIAPFSEYPRPKYQPAKAGLAGTIIPLSCLKNYVETPRTAWPPASLLRVEEV